MMIRPPPLLGRHVMDLSCELWSNILSMLARCDLYRACTVSHGWASLALDIMWADMDDMAPLLRVLGPMRHNGAGYLVSK